MIDELHTYRGVFGSHVANVLRRLLRLCAPLRLEPDHRLLARRRSGTRPSSRRSSPAGTPRLDRPQRRAGRRPAHPARRPAAARPGDRCARLGADASPSAGRCRSCAPVARRSCSGGRGSPSRSSSPGCASRSASISGRARGSAATAAATCPPSGARSSAGLRDGEILGVVSTNALELGVDIGRAGRVDPRRLPGLGRGHVAAARPRRAAPGGRASAILVASGSPVDQYVIHHPEFLLDGLAGGGADRPGQPPRAARPPPVRDVRAAVRAGRRVRRRARSTICSRSSARRATSGRPATAAGTGARRTSRPRRSACGRPPRRTS